MKQLVKSLALIALVVAVSPIVRAADTDAPNINKRGEDEKAFAEKLAASIVKAARTSVKKSTLEKIEKKTPKEGRTEWHITAKFEGAATKADYVADIVVVLDTTDKNNWEVLNIEYKDTSKSLIGHNRKNVEMMVKKLNGK